VFNKYKGAEISVVASNRNVSMFKSAPIDDLVLLKKKKFGLHWLDFYRQYKDVEWDFILNIRNSIAARFLKYKEMSSLSKNWLSIHKWKHYATLIDKADNPPKMTLWTSKEDKRAAKEIADKYKGKIIAVTPSSSWPKKNWPIERYVELLSKLTGKGGVLENANIAFIGGPGDRKYLPPFEKKFGNKLIDLAGVLSLTAAFEFLKLCEMFVGNDTGLAHMSAVAGIPTFPLFGLFDSSKEFRPIGDKVHLIRKDVKFRFLKQLATKHEHYMDHLSVDFVYGEIKDNLNKL
jgi:ADP-heptose:LPS heptosyltransferase